MKIETDPLFEVAINFLENGGELPEGVTGNAKQRFVFQAAVMRHLYRETKNAKACAETAQHQSEKNASEIRVLEERVAARTGLLASAAGVSTAIAAGVMVLAKVLGWI
jgi:hypothetical protein